MTTQYFRSFSAGASTITADVHGSDLVLVEGSNISLSANAETGELTIAASGDINASLPITQDSSTNATNYLVFSQTSSGDLFPRTDNDLYYNPFTNTLTAGAFNGPSSGWSTARTVSFSGGDVTGSFSIDGTANVSNVVLSLAGGGSGYTLPTATTTVLGGVKIDGTTVTINGNGVISSFSGNYNDLTNTPAIPSAFSFKIAGDDSTQRLISNGETIKFAGASGITVTTDAEGAVTISGGGGGADLSNVAESILPSIDNTYDLGSLSKRWRHLYVGPGSIYVGDETRSITVTPTSIDLPFGTTIGGEEPLKTTIQNIYNEIINNYLVYSDIPGAPIPVDDIDQLGDLNNRLTPVAITGVTYPNNGSSVSTEGNETVILTGTGFQRACNVLINNAPAVSTSFVNSTSVQFITTAQTAGTYIITLVNPDATTAVLSPGIQYLAPGAPRFIDPPGQLAAYSRNLSVSKTLSITGGTAPYTITILSGALPSGLSLNSSTGVISGTTPDVTFDTVFNFVAQVSDSADPVQSTTSSFYILVALPVPVELTIGGPGVSGASTIISNNAFFIKYEEDITNTPTFTITGTAVKSYVA